MSAHLLHHAKAVSATFGLAVLIGGIDDAARWCNKRAFFIGSSSSSGCDDGEHLHRRSAIEIRPIFCRYCSEAAPSSPTVVGNSTAAVTSDNNSNNSNYSNNSNNSNNSHNSHNSNYSKSNKTNCELYNSFAERFQIFGRKDRCSSNINCVFVGGNSFTGHCSNKKNKVMLESTFIPSAEETKVEKPSKKRVFVEILGLDGNIKRIDALIDKGLDNSIKQLDGLMSKEITATAIDSIKDSQRAMNEIAKTLIHDVLGNEQHYDSFGIFLQNLFKHDTVASYCRWLIYWSIATDYNVQYSYEIFKRQLEFYLTVHNFNYDPSHINYTDPSYMPLTLVIRSGTWWLHQEYAKKEYLVPAIVWLFNQEKDVVLPLADITAGLRPHLEEQAVDAMLHYVLGYLKSAEVKKTAKIGIIDLFHKYGKATDKPGKSPQESTEKK